LEGHFVSTSVAWKYPASALYLPFATTLVAISKLFGAAPSSTTLHSFPCSSIRKKVNCVGVFHVALQERHRPENDENNNYGTGNQDFCIHTASPLLLGFFFQLLQFPLDAKEVRIHTEPHNEGYYQDNEQGILIQEIEHLKTPAL
jgi:hypothetical protein